MFQELPVQHVESWSSYHYPIVMEVVERRKKVGYSKKTFPMIHYEDMWSLYEKCQEIIRREWWEQCRCEEANVIEMFKKAAKKSMDELSLWSSNEFGRREKKVKKLIDELKYTRRSYDHYGNGHKIRMLEKQIDNILVDEEVYWK